MYVLVCYFCFFCQAEDGIRDAQESRGLGDVYKRQLQYSGITGIKYVELSGGTNEAKRIKPNSTIPTAPGLGERAEGIVSDVELAVQRVNTLLKPENQENIGLFLRNIQASSLSIKSVLASKREQFSEILNRLDTISQNLEKTSVNLSELSSSLKNRAESRQIDQLLAQSEKLLKELTLRFSEKEMGGVVTRLNELILTTHDGINKLQGTLGAQSTEINSSLTSLKASLEDISQSVSYTHLTLPTTYAVEISVAAVTFI